MANYYETLGVSKNASDKELKTAFRKLAAKYHPDAGGDEEKFKQINEAYNTLKDPQKRTMYDQFGTADPQQAQARQSYNFSQNSPFGNFNFTGNPADLQDIFAMFGNGGGQRYRPPKNKDIGLNYTLEFADIFQDKTTTLQYGLPSGKQEVVEIKIPAGIKNGDTVRITGHGDNSIKHLPRGNLILKIRVNGLKGWQREGDDLHTMQQISIFDLLLGSTIELNTPQGKSLEVKIPKGTQPGTVLSMAGYGIPNVNTSRKGNLYLKLKGVIPKLTDEQMDLIRKVKDGLDIRTK